MLDKSNICFIRARQRGGDYIFEGIANSGYRIIIPYRDYNLFLRCMREAWFRLHLPHHKIWFNPKIKRISADTIIAWDPLMTPDLLKWTRDAHPNKRIILAYGNCAARSIDPNSVSQLAIELWTGFPEDSKQYGMKLLHPFFYDIYQVKERKEPVYDILYVGRDKGRGEQLLDLQKQFETMGLRTYFHICADRSYLRYKKSYYKPLLPYREYLKLLTKSRAILNVMPEGQTAITQREYEAIFDGVKCITTNRAIREFEMYDPSRYFILGEDKIEDIPTFLDMAFKAIPEEQLDKYRFDAGIENMIKEVR